MANKKISALNALLGSAAATGDQLVIVDVSATETKYITRTEFFKNVPNLTVEGAVVFNDNGADVDVRMEGDTDANLFFLDASTDRIGIGTATPLSKLHVNGSFGINAPVTVTANYTVAATDTFIINNRAASNTLTLPTASGCTGRMLFILTLQAQTVISASGNVIPRTSTSASTAILAGVAGTWAILVSNGTNWQIVAGN